MDCMWQAVARGFVRHEDAVFAQQGLRYGFKAGIDVTRMLGHAPLAPQALETGDFGIVEPIL